MPLLNRKAQIVVALESVEGTAVTMAASDATMLVYDPDFADQTEMFERNPARATLSRLKRIVGKELGQISWRTELKGSGAVGTRPAWDKAFRASGFTGAVVAAATVTGMTGSFQPGETFTVTTTSQTGRVVGRHNSATVLYYVPLTGTVPSGATIVGGTSSAQAIASAAGTTGHGFEYLPGSSAIPSATVALYRDGKRYRIFGARGNVSIETRVGEPPFLAFTFQGVYSETVDADLLTITYESTDPVAFKNATSRIDDLDAKFSTLSIDMANTLTQREAASAAKGVYSMLITDRAPQMTVDPEMELVATKDFYGRLHAATTGWFATQIGSTLGNIVRIGSPRIQYASIGQGERNSLYIGNLTFDLIAADVSSGDDELQLGCL